jgi:hypothetical protein
MVAKSAALVALEYPDEVDAFAAQIASEPWMEHAEALVALNPRTRAHMQRLGFSAESTIAYLDPASRERAWRRSAEITDWTRTRFEFEDSLGVRAGYLENLVWYVRWLVHDLLWSLEILHNLASLHPGTSLVVCIPEETPHFGPATSPEERYFGVMAAAFAAIHGMGVHTISMQPRPPVAQGASGSLRRLARAAARTPLVQRWHLQRMRKVGRSKPALFTSSLFRMDALAVRVVREIGMATAVASEYGSAPSPPLPWRRRATGPFAAEARLQLIEPLVREDPASLDRLKAVVDRFIDEVARESTVFSHLGVSFAAIVADKIRAGIGPFLLGLHRRAAAWQCLLGAMQPALVFSSGVRVDDMVVGELCQAANIPALMVSHGSHTLQSSDVERYEWGEHARRLINSSYQYTALQSPLAEGFRTSFPAGNEAIATGPLIWAAGARSPRSAALRRSMLGEGSYRVIVHAGTPKGKGTRRFHVFETPDEYVQGIKELDAAIREIPDARLIVKFRPSPEVGLGDLNALIDFSERTIVSVDEPLLDVLGFADLLVSFSSTVIEEALQNGIPVLLYGGGGRYRHVPAPADAGHEPSADLVHHVETIEDLAPTIRRVLAPSSGEPANAYAYDPGQVVGLPELVRLMTTSVPDRTERKLLQ